MGYGLVKNEMGSDPTRAAAIVFFNGPRDKVKMLVWDADGYVIYAKRLERADGANSAARTKTTVFYSI